MLWEHYSLLDICVYSETADGNHRCLAEKNVLIALICPVDHMMVLRVKGWSAQAVYGRNLSPCLFVFVHTLAC